MNTRPASANHATELPARIGKREAQVGIIGLGYVGLPLALLFSEEKFRVTGFDIDQKKIDTLESGGSYMYRIPREELATAKCSGFSATTDFVQLSGMDAII